jgi:hypothetical protein
MKLGILIIILLILKDYTIKQFINIESFYHKLLRKFAKLHYKYTINEYYNYAFVAFKVKRYL